MESILIVNSKLQDNGKDDFGFYDPVINKKISLIKNKVKCKDFILEAKFGATRSPIYTEEGIFFIRATNIKENGIEGERKYFPATDEDSLKKYFLKKGDVLIVRSGVNVGDTTAINKEFKGSVYGSYCIKLVIDQQKVNPEYFSIYMNSLFGKLQVKRLSTRSAQQNINTEEICSIIFSLISLKEQDAVVNIMKSTYFLHKQKLKQAEEELGKINDYVLKELRINLEEVKSKKSFLINASNLKKRDDYPHYNGIFESIRKVLNSSKYEVKLLGEIIDSITSGSRPKGGVGNIEEGIISLGGLHLSNKGEIVYEGKERYIPSEFHKLNIETSIKPNDILVVKDGATTGKVAIVPEDFPLKDCNINEHLFRLRVKKGCLAYYLFSYLYSDIGQIQIQHFKSGATVMGITREAISSVLVPLPLLEVQKNFADYVNLCKKNSKEIRIQAKKLLNKSKRIIEKMIIKEALTKQEEQFCEDVIKEAKQLGFKE